MVGTRNLFQLVWVALLACQFGSHAQPLSNIPRQDFWVTDGAVNAIAVTNDRVFIGGDFRYVGPYTGGGVPVDVNTMQPVPKYPKVNGSVHAVEPDGQGGWFIGGLFTTVGGRPRTNLAHITAAGEVNTNWVAHATGGPNLGWVQKLARDGASLYIVGSFTNLGGASRRYLGAVEVASGTVTPWAPQVDTNVLAIAISPTAIYLGGKFLTLNGAERRYVGAVNKSDGQLVAWNPWDPLVNPIMYYNFVTNAYPLALTAVNGWVIVPGSFRTGFAFVNLAAFKETDSTWVWGRGGADTITDLKVYDGNLYVAGRFTSIGGDGTGGAVSRTNLAAIDLNLGARVTDWIPADAGAEQSLAFHENSVFALGWFQNKNPFRGTSIRTNADHIARVDLSTGAALSPFRPFNNGPVLAAAVQGNQLYLGGAFSSVGGYQHEHLAELDGRDGSPRTWAPQPNGPVTALKIADERLYVGGFFSQLSGEPRTRLGAFDLPALLLSDWTSELVQDTSIATGPAVVEIIPYANGLFVAGEFQQVGGQPRTNLAHLDRMTGQVLDWRVDADGRIATAALAGRYLYVGGYFSKLGALDRPRLGRIDLDSSEVDSWAPGPDGPVNHLSVNFNSVYLSGQFTHISEMPRRGFAAFDLPTGTLIPWSLDYLQASFQLPAGWPLLALSDMVVASGFFQTGESAESYLAFEPETAASLSWSVRPYHLGTPKRIHHDGRRLLIIGGDEFTFGPSRSTIAVFEQAGFSEFTSVDSGTSLTLTIAADQGRQVTVERTEDFDSWTGVSTNISWEGVLEVIDPILPGHKAIFYRSKTSQP